MVRVLVPVVVMAMCVRVVMRMVIVEMTADFHFATAQSAATFFAHKLCFVAADVSPLHLITAQSGPTYIGCYGVSSKLHRCDLQFPPAP